MELINSILIESGAGDRFCVLFVESDEPNEPTSEDAESITGQPSGGICCASAMNTLLIYQPSLQTMGDRRLRSNGFESPKTMPFGPLASDTFLFAAVKLFCVLTCHQ